MDGLWASSKDFVMTFFLMGLLVGFVVGYGVGLFIDKWDKGIKDGGR